MVRNNGRSSRWPMVSTRSLVTTYATYGTLSLRVDYQPPGQRPRFARSACKRVMWITYQQIAYLSTGYKSAK